jgi:hypothetical protein
MVNLEYHKGQLCSYGPILCQEGFCSECIIFLEKVPNAVSRYIRTKSTSKKKNVSKITIGGVDQKSPHFIQPRP